MTRYSIDLGLLSRYFEGTATAEEAAAVLAWIGNDADRQAAIVELAAAWVSDARRLEAAYDAKAAFASVASRLEELRPAAPTQRRPRRIVRAWRSAPVAAWAAALLIAAFGAGWWAIAARTADESATVASADAMREYATARAQRAVIQLSDGSEVILNAASRLRVPQDFSPTRRQLYLEGEGYFNVAHNDNAPFTVHTPRGIARNLATKFSVRAYTDDPTKDLEVIVAEGVVAIAARPGGDSLILRAAQVGTVTETGELRAEHNIDVRSRLGWTEGRLEFVNVPLGDVIPAIARWYDEAITLKDPELASYPITATLTGERFADAIDAIARVTGVQVVRRNNETQLVRHCWGREPSCD